MGPSGDAETAQGQGESRHLSATAELKKLGSAMDQTLLPEQDTPLAL